MNKPTEFDIGPLSWVKGEIDQAMERASQALHKYVENPEDAKQLKFCQTHLHQAVGALQIVGLDGVTRLSEEVEALLADIEKQAVLPNPQVFELIDRIRAEGLTVLIVEQNVQQVLDVVDRAYLLEVGTIKLSGTSAELKGNDFIRKSYMGL